FWGKRGPVEGIAADPRYLDISIPPNRRKTFKVELGRHAFAYIFTGSGRFANASDPQFIPTEAVGKAVDEIDLAATLSNALDNRHLILFDQGDEVTVQAGDEGLRFLLISGKPLKEPVAWYGPIVMNTQAELQQAMRDLQSGTFLKHE